MKDLDESMYWKLLCIVSKIQTTVIRWLSLQDVLFSPLFIDSHKKYIIFLDSVLFPLYNLLQKYRNILISTEMELQLFLSEVTR